MAKIAATRARYFSRPFSERNEDPVFIWPFILGLFFGPKINKWPNNNGGFASQAIILRLKNIALVK